MTREALSKGTEIDRYLLKQVLSEDGRGISYLAVDAASVSGSSKVLVREYFPRGISIRDGATIEPRDRPEAREEFAIGLAGFIEAAKDLIDLKTHTLVPAHDLVILNSTAYLVLEWPEGRLFSDVVKDNSLMSADELRSQLSILLSGLDDLHKAGLLHTALTPDTLIRLDDGYPAISNLTHVERYQGADINRTHLILDTPYAAPELSSQSRSQTGPWTDIYSLSATCWFLLTGSPPPSASARLAAISTGRGDLITKDELLELGEDYQPIAEAILTGLELIPERRFASAPAFSAALTRRPSQLPAFLAHPVSLFSKHKVAATAIAAVFAIGVVGLSMGGGTQTDLPVSNVAKAPEHVDGNKGPLQPNFAELKSVDTAGLEWTFTDQSSPGAVRAFMAKHQDNSNALAAASSQLEELDQLAWSAAGSDGSVGALETYLSDFSAEMTPPGAFIDEAKQQLIELAGLHDFQVAETRRLLFALGYKTNSRRGETPGLKRAVLGFQESVGVETDGEISEELLELMSAEVTRREEEADAIAAAEVEAAQKLADAKTLAAEQAAANDRLVKLVHVAATASTRSATGVVDKPARLKTAKDKSEATMIAAPKAKPQVIYETKIASSKITSGSITSEDIVKSRTREAGETFRDCKSCPELVVLPAGSFQMGSQKSERGRLSDEGPVHAVEITRSFAMGKLEVTLGQYEAFVKATNRAVPAGCAAESDEKNGAWVVNKSLNYRSPGFSQSATHPATCVSWGDAKAYTKWLSRKTGQTYRLASEAEWEYAARAGTATVRHFGRSYRNGCKYVNGADRSAGTVHEHWVTAKCRDGHSATAPTGSFLANGFGLHDMLGNVWEWTEDCYSGSYTSTPRTELAHKTKTCRSRVTRGGSWATNSDLLRSAARSADASTARYDMLGFRVVRELPTN